MITIGIETSCDETAVSLIEDGYKKILSNTVFSQIKTHKKYGGVVQEICRGIFRQVLIMIASLEEANKTFVI